MKIVAPYNSIKEIRELVKAGADELYVGFNPDYWKKKYSNIISINRRYFPKSQIRSIGELKKSIKLANELGLKVSLTLNAHNYNKKQYPAVIKLARQSGANNFIISDPYLLTKLKNCTISTGGLCINEYAVNFFEKKGANRIILPRQMKISEIYDIRKKTKVELEAFMLFDTCKNIDGYCNFLHGCEELIGSEHGCIYLNKYRSDSSLAQKRIESIEFPMFCGACFIKDFKKMGIDAIKIVGRRFPTQTKVKAIRFLKAVIKKPNQAMELFEEFFDRHCPKNNCNYYGY
jgi:collagenase-like PrtC family protease